MASAVVTLLLLCGSPLAFASAAEPASLCWHGDGSMCDAASLLQVRSAKEHKAVGVELPAILMKSAEVAFRAWDKDGDLKVSLPELREAGASRSQGEVTASFAAADGDSDGFLSSNEVARAMYPWFDPTTRTAWSAKVVQALDQDEDGTVSHEEWGPEMSQEWFSKFDADGSGRHERDEVEKLGLALVDWVEAMAKNRDIEERDQAAALGSFSHLTSAAGACLLSGVWHSPLNHTVAFASDDHVLTLRLDDAPELVLRHDTDGVLVQVLIGGKEHNLDTHVDALKEVILASAVDHFGKLSDSLGVKGLHGDKAPCYMKLHWSLLSMTKLRRRYHSTPSPPKPRSLIGAEAVTATGFDKWTGYHRPTMPTINGRAITATGIDKVTNLVLPHDSRDSRCPKFSGAWQDNEGKPWKCSGESGFVKPVPFGDGDPAAAPYTGAGVAIGAHGGIIGMAAGALAGSIIGHVVGNPTTVDCSPAQMAGWRRQSASPHCQGMCGQGCKCWLGICGHYQCTYETECCVHDFLCGDNGKMSGGCLNIMWGIWACNNAHIYKYGGPLKGGHGCATNNDHWCQSGECRSWWNGWYCD